MKPATLRGRRAPSSARRLIFVSPSARQSGTAVWYGSGRDRPSDASADRFARQLGSGVHAELGEGVREMGLDRAPTDEEPLADLRIGESLGEELDDRALCWREALPSHRRTLAFASGTGGISQCVGERQRTPVAACDLEGVCTEGLPRDRQGVA